MSVDLESKFGLTSQQAFEYAEKHGLRVIYPTAYELFIDIDSPQDQQTFDKNYSLLSSAYGFTGCSSKPSRRKEHGMHVTVTMNRPVTPIERVALQASLGSDARREAHSLNRIIAGDSLPTLFFEKKCS